MNGKQAYDTIARFYDLEHADFTDDLAFYRQIVTRGPVLEVGAGTGRVMIGLSGEGVEVWGTEPNTSMASIARPKLDAKPNVHLVEGDLESLSSDVAFAYALLPLNTLWHFTSSADQLEVLHKIHARLEMDGLLVIDSTNPLSMADRGAGGELRLRFSRDVVDGYIAGYSAAWDNPAEQILDVTFLYETTAGGQLEKSLADLRLRYVYVAELELMLRLTGFDLRNVYGDYDLEPYGPESPQLLVVASKRS